MKEENALPYEHKHLDMRMLRVSSDAERQDLIEHTFGRLLSGTDFPMPLLLMPLEINGIFLSNGMYVLCSFSFSNANEDYAGIFDLSQMYEDLKFHVKEELSRHCINHIVEFEGVVTAICCYFLHEPENSYNQAGQRQMCLSTCEDICADWQKRTGAPINFVCSEAFSGVENIRKEYLKIQQTFALRRFLASGRNTYVPDLSVIGTLDTDAIRFVDALKSMDAARTDALMEEILPAFFEREPQTMLDFDFRLQYFISRVDQLLTANRTLPDILAKQLRSISYPDSPEQLTRALSDFARDIITHISNGKNSDLGFLVSQIKDMVFANLTSGTLSVAWLADELEMNPSTLSNRFKKMTGIKIVDYIARARLSYAENLLISTDMQIDAIAQSAGYGSVSTMYRAFQKLRGKSPTVIRNELKLSSAIQ